MQATPVSSRAGKGGPKTPEGKMRSARNAVKHGLSSAQPVILQFETSEAWEAFRAPLVESLHPATAAERQLAEGIALTLWRQRRIPLHEAARAGARVEAAEARWEEYALRFPEETEESLREVLQGSITRALFHADAEAGHLLRYEAHLDRKLSRHLRELGALQKARNYETNSPPKLKARNCETKGHALRAPESHEDEEVIPSSETPSRVLPLEHPSAGRAPLWSPWRGAQRSD